MLPQEDLHDTSIQNDAALEYLHTQAVSVHEISVLHSMASRRSSKVRRLRLLVRASVMFSFTCRVIKGLDEPAVPIIWCFWSLRCAFSRYWFWLGIRVFVSFICPLYVYPFRKQTSRGAIVSHDCFEYVLQVGESAFLHHSPLRGGMWEYGALG